MKICMLVKNSFEYDARVTKEACTLIEAGHQVTVIAIQVPGQTAEHEVRPDGIEVHRVSRMQFGVPALNRIASRYVGTVEERRARLVGEPVDDDVIRGLGTFHVPSTSTPGASTATVTPTPVEPDPGQDDAQDAPPPSRVTRSWGRVSTAVLRFVARLARFAFKLVKFLMGRQGRAVKTYAINRRFIEAAIATGADVFHAHDLNTLYVGTVCKRRTGAKLVYDSHELATERNRMGFWWKRRCLYWERRGIPHADAVIMASPGYAEAARRLYGVESTVIVNVPEPQTPTGTRQLRDQVPVRPDDMLLIYQGSIQENRGIEQVIDAVEMLEQVSLVVVGYGHHRPVLEALVRRRQMDDRVHFFGPVPNDELVDWSSSADIGMCNIVGSSLSYRESLPNKLFEYVMAGIPVVVSNFGAMGRICEEEGVGLTCDPTDPQALADAIDKLREPSVYQACRSATPAMAATYNWQVEQAKLVEVYGTLATG